MPNPSLIQLTMQCLRQQTQALTPRELARNLLNQRSISGITLDALTERIQVDLEMERHTRGEASRFTRYGERYALLGLVELEHQTQDSVSQTHQETTQIDEHQAEESHINLHHDRPHTQGQRTRQRQIPTQRGKRMGNSTDLV